MQPRDLMGSSHFVRTYMTPQQPILRCILKSGLFLKMTMILVCRDVSSCNSINITYFFSNYHAAMSNTRPWTPETTVIDSLMRNMERRGEAQH